VQYRTFHKEYQYHGDAVTTLASVPSANKVWSGSADMKLCIWKML